MDEQTRHTVRDLVLDEDRFRRLTLNTGRQTAPDAWRRVVVRPVQLRGGATCSSPTSTPART